MTSPAAPPAVPRTYGGWRRARGLGLLGLSMGQTLAALGAVVVVVLAAAINVRALLYLAPPLAIGLGGALARWDGVPVTHLVLQRVRWWRARRRGWHQLRAGVVTDHPRAWQLPGVLAPMALVSAEDGLGGRYGLVHDRRSGLLTATVRVAATSTWLAGSDADGWVANWGGWLAGLGYLPAIRWVTVTVDTAPDPGSTLADQVLGALDPAAPAAATAIMRELVTVAPASAADVETRVSISYDPALSPAKPETMLEAAGDFGRMLYGLESALEGCGVTVLGRATAPALAGIVRAAFDPAARGDVDRLAGTAHVEVPLTWADAGPVAAEENWGHYRHDSGISVTWGWREAPRQAVQADVLARLVAPGLYSKRVTVLYRPMSAGGAARLLESEVNAAAFRTQYHHQTGRDATARDQADAERAHRAAREEAAGAGVCLVSVYVTVTVANTADLPRAVADVEARADTAKVRLRRLYAGQAAGFATTLPCGICPPVLALRWPH